MSRIFLAFTRALIPALAVLLSVHPGEADDKLTCEQVKDLIQFRTGINLWNARPKIVLDTLDHSLAERLTIQASNIPNALWTYLTRFCASCNSSQAADTGVLLRTISDFQSIPGGTEIYTPGEFNTEKARIAYLEAQFSSGRSSYTSLSVFVREIRPARQLTIISVFSNALIDKDIRSDLFISFFEAFVDIKFWSEPDSRSKLIGEFRAVCLDGNYNSCPVLQLWQFLYTNRDKFNWKGMPQQMAVLDLCKRYNAQ